MRTLLAITRRELLVYFTTPLAYVMLALLIFIGSWLFLSRVDLFLALTLQYRSATQPEALAGLNLTDIVMLPMVGYLGTLLLFIAPFLTMRLIAEEKSRGTFELLMTLPVRPLHIVLGKYLSVLILLFVTLVLLLVYPLLLSWVGTGEAGAVEWPTILCGWLGLFLLGAGLTAVGLFVSTLTDSQAVAALVTLVVSLLMFLIASNASSLEGPARAVFEYLSASHHLHRFASGLLEAGSISYFLSWIVLGLFLSHRALEGHRWSA